MELTCCIYLCELKVLLLAVASVLHEIHLDCQWFSMDRDDPVFSQFLNIQWSEVTKCAECIFGWIESLSSNWCILKHFLYIFQLFLFHHFEKGKVLVDLLLDILLQLFEGDSIIFIIPPISAKQHYCLSLIFFIFNFFFNF